MSDSAEPSQQVQIIADLSACISYASWQNSVPVLKSLVVSNPTTNSLEHLTLRLESSSGFLEPKEWKLDRLSPGDHHKIEDRNIELDFEFLSGLNESEKSVVNFSLSNSTSTVAEFRAEIRLLAKNEWGGMDSGGELLAAFVMPNDPAIAKILKSAATILQQNGQPSALDGYQSGDPRRTYLLVAAIWNSICGMKLTYASPPKSFESAGQKVRMPATIETEKLATCLDSTLLFASAIEAIGLHPVIIMTNGHCFVGAWLTENTLNQITETDVSEIRKAIAAHELITFETTQVTQSPPGGFKDAVRVAKSATSVAMEADFVAAIDIQRARMAQIRPLASHSRKIKQPEEQSTDEAAFLPLPEAPSFSNLPADVVDEKPTTPSGRIDRWQRKLLDLTLRNRLLNFRSTLKTVPILCNDIAKLEDILASNKRLKLISLPDQNPLGQRDPELHRQKTDRDLNVEFATKAFDRKEVCCVLPTEQMEKRLVTLYRAAKNDMAEGGTNTMFLAVGFLRWKQKPNDKKSYRAPLLLVPIKLTRRSSQSPFYLKMHEDETRFNATLIQMLKLDFGKDMTQFETDLPCDESGVDVPLILQQVRQHVRDIAGTEVIDECALGRFSFAKYLLWKDLVDRTSQLKNNRVVRHLLDGKDKTFDNGQSTIPVPEEMDKRFHPNELFYALDADSSQLAAIMAASDNKDFVLIGPPGTGKSQTITNIISQCLATGKTVLFVAEKTAALDVVHRRLVQHGLGDCCVELHSNKAERKTFLAQLQSNWTNNRTADANDWIEVNDQLKLRRDELNSYVSTINKVQPNGWTAFQAFWESTNGTDSPDLKFGWEATERHDQATYQKLETIAQDLADSFTSLDGDTTLSSINATEWSIKWERELLNQASSLSSATKSLQQVLNSFTASIGIANCSAVSMTQVDKLKQLSTAIASCGGEDLRIMFNKKFSKFSGAVSDLESDITKYNSAIDSMSGNYGTNLETLPLEDFDMKWRSASANFWPFSWFAKRKVKRLLQTYAESGKADPKTDIDAIRQIREQAVKIASNPLKDQSKHWSSNETDLGKLKQEIGKAKQLRDAIKLAGAEFDSTKAISQALLPFITGKSKSSEPAKLSQQFASELTQFNAAVKNFSKQAGKHPIEDSTESVLATSTRITETIQENRTKLKRWTAWCLAKSKAEAMGLKSLSQSLEKKLVEPDSLVKHFRVGYARWFIPILVDETPILRTFEKFKHEKTIEDFCRLDDLARKLASGKARQAIAHGLPTPSDVTKKSELGLLRHQMQLKRPSKSIRDVVVGMPESFRQLAPCLLMSPLSIAQYLPANQPPFDVVVFDEASQITTWDAIGAIARGKQTIIVGDPKQLPPTNFFGKNDDDEYDEELAEEEKDLESILDEAKASGLPELLLNWHYRSRHESLIAFSNYQYYGNRLITFPAADDENKGVSLTRVPDAFYDLGKSRTNKTEAQAIVDEAIDRMQQQLLLPADDRRTYGVITFNTQQQSLIQDLFDQALKENSDCEWFFSDDRIEPTIVKNLENVQGDERDVMFFSITFGPTESNPRISRNFGAINRPGGQRRLNVAVTRARQQMLVYSSFDPEMLDTTGLKNQGVSHLKKFLVFANSNGESPLGSQNQDSVGGFDSPFEEAVSQALEMRGWIAVPQIGVSGFRIDLGIKHPDKPGTYLAGIECDGATYHRSAAARDRDKTRQLVLEGLGWNILRIWSPDWWYDPIGVAAKIIDRLDELLAQDRLKDQRAAVNAETEPNVDAATKPTPSEDVNEEPLSLDHQNDEEETSTGDGSSTDS